MQDRRAPASCAIASTDVVPNSSHSSATSIEEPSYNDVIFAENGISLKNHVGTENWRRLVNLNKKLYTKLPKHRKKLVVTSIVKAILQQDPPGKFLTKDNNKGSWSPIDTEGATEITERALEELDSEPTGNVRVKDKPTKVIHIGNHEEKPTNADKSINLRRSNNGLHRAVSAPYRSVPLEKPKRNRSEGYYSYKTGDEKEDNDLTMERNHISNIKVKKTATKVVIERTPLDKNKATAAPINHPTECPSATEEKRKFFIPISPPPMTLSQKIDKSMPPPGKKIDASSRDGPSSTKAPPPTHVPSACKVPTEVKSSPKVPKRSSDDDDDDADKITSSDAVSPRTTNRRQSYFSENDRGRDEAYSPDKNRERSNNECLVTKVKASSGKAEVSESSSSGSGKDNMPLPSTNLNNYVNCLLDMKSGKLKEAEESKSSSESCKDNMSLRSTNSNRSGKSLSDSKSSASKDPSKSSSDDSGKDNMSQNSTASNRSFHSSLFNSSEDESKDSAYEPTTIHPEKPLPHIDEEMRRILAGGLPEPECVRITSKSILKQTSSYSDKHSLLVGKQHPQAGQGHYVDFSSSCDWDSVQFNQITFNQINQTPLSRNSSLGMAEHADVTSSNLKPTCLGIASSLTLHNTNSLEVGTLKRQHSQKPKSLTVDLTSLKRYGSLTKYKHTSPDPTSLSRNCSLTSVSMAPSSQGMSEISDQLSLGSMNITLSRSVSKSGSVKDAFGEYVLSSDKVLTLAPPTLTSGPSLTRGSSLTLTMAPPSLSRGPSLNNAPPTLLRCPSLTRGSSLTLTMTPTNLSRGPSLTAAPPNLSRYPSLTITMPNLSRGPSVALSDMDLSIFTTRDEMTSDSFEGGGEGKCGAVGVEEMLLKQITFISD